MCRVSLFPTMIALYTMNAAWGMHQGKGNRLDRVGKQADLVVLDRNL
jgi:predicted amidohydrolase YtcJ